jgi:hypothetical protein
MLRRVILLAQNRVEAKTGGNGDPLACGAAGSGFWLEGSLPRLFLFVWG